MCIAFPGKIQSVKGHSAVVSYGTEKRDIMIGSEAVKPGDWVLVQMGIAVKILSDEEATESLKAWNIDPQTIA